MSFFFTLAFLLFSLLIESYMLEFSVINAVIIDCIVLLITLKRYRVLRVNTFMFLCVMHMMYNIYCILFVNAVLQIKSVMCIGCSTCCMVF